MRDIPKNGCEGDYREYDFSKLVVKSLSLELIELTISCCGVEGSSPETVMTDKLQVHTVTHKVDLKSNHHAKTF